MTETFTDFGALVTWSAPQCPFVIEYSRKALDDIRLAVVDAFFSLPRGGAEIGGILLGRLEEPRLQVLEYAPLECEHASGPAFTLSPKDQTRLSEMLAEAPQRYPGLQVVGWYHSHTRSEISLCEADLEIHNRYFPERWQVALVLRPSTLQPTQAGFFFREADGSVRSQSSYQEFTLETLPARPLPSGVPVAVPGPVHETAPESVVITLPSAQTSVASAVPTTPATEVTPTAIAPFAPEPLPAPWADAFATRAPERPAPPASADSSPEAPEPPVSVMETDHETEGAPASDLFFRATETEPSSGDSQTEYEQPAETWKPSQEAMAQEEPADFAETVHEAPRAARRWVGIAAGVFAGIALGVVVDQTRSHAGQPAPTPPQTVQTAAPRTPGAASFGVDAALRKQNDDLSKQNAALTAEISGLRKQNSDLLKQQSPSGNEQAAISKQQAGLDKQQAALGKQQGDLDKQQAELRRQQAEFTKQQADWNKRQTAQAQQQTTLSQQEGQLRQQRDDLAKQTAKLKADLSTETARAQSLQAQVEELRRQAQRRRLSVQSTDQQP